LARRNTAAADGSLGNVESTVDIPAGFSGNCLLDHCRRTVLFQQVPWHGRVRGGRRGKPRTREAQRTPI